MNQNQIDPKIQNLNSGESHNDKNDPCYLILQKYKKFISEIQIMKDNNLDNLEINIIDKSISQGKLSYSPVYLLEANNFKYFLSYLKKLDYSISIIYVNIIYPDDYTIYNSSYSMINEEICKGINLAEDKYKPYKALLFKCKNKYYLYYKKQKKLLLIKNYTDNTFQLLTINLLKESILKKPATPTIPSIPKPIYPVHCLGLENIGATCYMNATLQCLCHVTSLKNYFQSINKDGKGVNNKEAPMAKSFSELLNKLWSQTYETYYAPHNFKDLISNLNPLFRGIQANDSKDLIIFIYETLHNELNNPTSDNYILNNLNNQNLPAELKLFRQNYFSQNNSIMTKIFYFEQSSNLKCVSCNVNKVSFNIINFLIFPLEKIRLYLIKKKPQGFLSVTLEDCFDQFEEQELLSGPNQIYCNSCHKQSNAISYNKLYNSPEVLTIILNRGKGLQFDVEFQFPLNLNINKYVIDKNCDTNYELIGVLTHLGPSGMSGHFIAYCKSPVNKQWYCYNDAQVTQCQNVMYEINSNGIPYVLYYQRKNIISSTETKNEDFPYDNYSNNKKKKDVLYFINNEGKEGYIDLNIEENKYLFEIYNEVKNKFDFLPKEENNFYIKRNNNMIHIDPYNGVKDFGLKSADKIYVGNNHKNTINNNQFVLIFSYEGKDIKVNVNIEENQLLYEIICDLKNKNEIPQEANNFLLIKDNDMPRIDTLKGVKENGLKNGDKICVVV